jgi:hypothetical protein
LISGCRRGAQAAKSSKLPRELRTAKTVLAFDHSNDLKNDVNTGAAAKLSSANCRGFTDHLTARFLRSVVRGWRLYSPVDSSAMKERANDFVQLSGGVDGMFYAQ